MKSHAIAEKNARRAKPLSRSERRAAERLDKREQTKRRRSGEGRVSPASIVGGGVMVLVVAAAIIYALLRSNASTGTSGALTDAGALNPGPSLLSVGQGTPDFTLRDVNGRVYNLAAQRGHPVLLEYFAVWCPVCRSEAPAMAGITHMYAARGVRVWSILSNPYGKNYDVSGRSDLTLVTKNDLSWYAQNFNVHHPQLIDPSFSTVNRYGIDAYSGIYIVNGKGIITYAQSGHQSFLKLSAALDKAGARMNMGMAP